MLHTPMLQNSKYLSYNDADRSKSTINIKYPTGAAIRHTRGTTEKQIKQLNRDYFDNSNRAVFYS